MKKFNMFALIALSLVLGGNVDAAQFGTFSATPARIMNQRGALAALKMASRPTSQNLMSRVIGTPASAASSLAVSSMGALTGDTRAKTSAIFDSAAFQEGAQVTNEQTSELAGGVNQMGQNVAASNSVQSAGLTGANLRGLRTLLTPAAPTSAMSTLTSNTRNSGKVSFTNSSQPRAGAPSSSNPDGTAGEPGVAPAATGLSPVAGTFGNVTSRIGLSTQGSSNMMAGSIGSSNMLNLSGNYGSNS